MGDTLREGCENSIGCMKAAPSGLYMTTVVCSLAGAVVVSSFAAGAGEGRKPGLVAADLKTNFLVS